MYDKGLYKPTYFNSTKNTDYYPFEQELSDWGSIKDTEQPWTYGSYQLFEMDEKRHKYKVITYVNMTSPFSTMLYPQFIIESIMKDAFKDDKFEFKFRTTPLPTPHST